MPLTCINLHLRVFLGARAMPASWYILRFPASCFGQISNGGEGSPIRWIWSISHHRSCADACAAKLCAFLHLCFELLEQSCGVLI
jgi:hypothetical protein